MKMIFLTVALGLLYNLVQGESAQCFSTGVAEICPGFGTKSVPPVFLPSGISSQGQFLVAFREHLVSLETNAQFQAMLGASTGFDMGGLGIRYLRSFTCASLLTSPLVSPCGNATIVPLCQSDCEVFWKSFFPMADDNTMCEQPEECRRRIQEKVDSCHLPPFNGAPGQCVQAEANEQATCGFSSLQGNKACSFCNSHKEACCDLAISENMCLNKQTSLNSPMFIVSLVLMTLALVLSSGTIVAFGYLRTRPYPQDSKALNVLLNYSKSISHTRDPSASSFYSDPHASFNTPSRIAPIQIKNPQAWGSILGKLHEGKLESKHQVVYSYLPVLEDEIVLEIGHLCIITQQFDDGWCIGRNLSTGEQGAFPLACLTSAPPDCLSLPASPVLSRPISPLSDSHIPLSPRTVSRRTSSLRRGNSFPRSLSNTSTVPGFYPPQSTRSSPP